MATEADCLKGIGTGMVLFGTRNAIIFTDFITEAINFKKIALCSYSNSLRTRNSDKSAFMMDY